MMLEEKAVSSSYTGRSAPGSIPNKHRQSFPVSRRWRLLYYGLLLVAFFALGIEFLLHLEPPFLYGTIHFVLLGISLFGFGFGFALALAHVPTRRDTSKASCVSDAIPPGCPLIVLPVEVDKAEHYSPVASDDRPCISITLSNLTRHQALEILQRQIEQTIPVVGQAPHTAEATEIAALSETGGCTELESSEPEQLSDNPNSLGRAIKADSSTTNVVVFRINEDVLQITPDVQWIHDVPASFSQMRARFLERTPEGIGNDGSRNVAWETHLICLAGPLTALLNKLADMSDSNVMTAAALLIPLREAICVNLALKPTGWEYIGRSALSYKDQDGRFLKDFLVDMDGFRPDQTDKAMEDARIRGVVFPGFIWPVDSPIAVVRMPTLCYMAPSRPVHGVYQAPTFAGNDLDSKHFRMKLEKQVLVDATSSWLTSSVSEGYKIIHERYRQQILRGNQSGSDLLTNESVVQAHFLELAHAANSVLRGLENISEAGEEATVTTRLRSFAALVYPLRSVFCYDFGLLPIGWEFLDRPPSAYYDFLQKNDTKCLEKSECFWDERTLSPILGSEDHWIIEGVLYPGFCWRELVEGGRTLHRMVRSPTFLCRHRYPSPTPKGRTTDG